MEVTFRARTALEGSRKKNLRITIPADLVRDLQLPRPGWVRLRVGNTRFFAYGRWPPSRSSMQVTLPVWLPERPEVGRTIALAVTDAEPYRAPPQPAAEGFDWLPYVGERFFPTETDGRLTIWSRYEEPLVMHRATPLGATYRLLGLYQAEGSKGATATDWTLSGNNSALLRNVVELLRGLGIHQDRIYSEILWGPEGREAAQKAFGGIARVSAVRQRPGKGGAAGVLHVSKSGALLEMFKGALDTVHQEGFSFPSQEAAREYALGWLDGDATVTIHRHTGGIELRLAGYKIEQEIVLKALEHGFVWTLPKTRFGTPDEHTGRTLRLDQAAELAVAGGFRFSMSRARLLWGLEQRLKRTANRGRTLTQPKDFEMAKALFDMHLRKEADALSLHPFAASGFNTGQKGAPYPL